jgi:hypothetical protein
MSDTKPVRFIPSNSDCGYSFINDWCCHCARDKPSSEGKHFDDCTDDELCGILAASFRGDAEEWVYGDDGPMCTAFVQAGHPIPLKDDMTLDMFEAH